MRYHGRSHRTDSSHFYIGLIGRAPRYRKCGKVNLEEQVKTLEKTGNEVVDCASNLKLGLCMISCCTTLDAVRLLFVYCASQSGLPFCYVIGIESKHWIGTIIPYYDLLLNRTNLYITLN